MKLLQIFVVACFIIAAAQAIANALAMLIILALIYGLFRYPGQTVSFLGLCVAAGLLDRHPLLLLAAITLLASFGIIFGRPANTG